MEGFFITIQQSGKHMFEQQNQQERGNSALNKQGWQNLNQRVESKGNSTTSFSSISTIHNPLAELVILKQIGTIEQYWKEFEYLLARVELSEDYSITCFLRGLGDEIQHVVRMFKPRTLYEALCLAKLQEATLASTVKEARPILAEPSQSQKIQIFDNLDKVERDTLIAAHKVFDKMPHAIIESEVSITNKNNLEVNQANDYEFGEMDFKDEGESLGRGYSFPEIEPKIYAQQVFEEMPHRIVNAKISTPVMIGGDNLLGNGSDGLGNSDVADKSKSSCLHETFQEFGKMSQPKAIMIMSSKTLWAENVIDSTENQPYNLAFAPMSGLKLKWGAKGRTPTCAASVTTERFTNCYLNGVRPMGHEGAFGFHITIFDPGRTPSFRWTGVVVPFESTLCYYSLGTTFGEEAPREAATWEPYSYIA